MPAYPEPSDGIALEHTNRSVSQRYPRRLDILLGIDALEVQGWMKGILRP
jgi:hypothetical protein